MALSFPNSPTEGQIYTDTPSGNRWVWDSANTIWKSTSTFTQTITVSSTAPGTPVVGQLWWNQDYGRLLVYYSDGTSSQWVDASPSDYTSGLAYNQANAAFGKANTALQNTSGTFSGTLSITGNVGIGIASPSAPLEVNDKIKVKAVGGLSINAIKGTYWGYSAGYPAIMLGSNNTSDFTTVAINYDPVINPNGSFSGDGREVIFRNYTRFTTPNSTNTSWYLDTITMNDGNVGIGLNPTSRNNSHLQVVDGIGFPATQVSSSDANTLDDYEEGTWTPTASPSSGTITSYTASGTYTKIGRVVQVNFLITITNAGTAAGAYLQYAGLPFTVSNSTKPVGVCRENSVNGYLHEVLADQSLTTGNITRYDNGGSIVNGGNFHCSLMYYT